jgi:hypothetical protein
MMAEITIAVWVPFCSSAPRHDENYRGGAQGKSVEA